MYCIHEEYGQMNSFISRVEFDEKIVDDFPEVFIVVLTRRV